MKRLQNSPEFSKKSFFLEAKSIFRQTFLRGNLRCLPRGDLRTLCNKQRDPIPGNSFIMANVGDAT